MNTNIQITQDSYVFSSADNFENAQRMATALSKSNLVPKEYQNNMPNCLIALEVANRVKASPLMVMQNLTIIYNRPSWSAQFVIASINTCGRFKPLRFDLKGAEGSDNRTCIAWTTERDVSIPSDVRTLDDAKKANLPVLQSPSISIGIAKKEGWYGKNGSKWQSMPELMLHYRAGTFFGRLYAPDILMGMETVEEIRDVGQIRDITPPTVQATSINEILHAEVSINDISDATIIEDETDPLSNRTADMYNRILDKEPEIGKSVEFKNLMSDLKAAGDKDSIGMLNGAFLE